MNISGLDLFNEFKNDAGFLELIGDTSIQKIAPVENGNENSIVFCDNKNYLKYIESNRPSCVVTNKELFEQIKLLGVKCIILSKNVAVSHAKLKQKFYDYNRYDVGFERIHSTAVIHNSVNLENNPHIGPHCVIGRNVKFGKNVLIEANSIIEENATIGDDVQIHANCIVGHDCIIGNRVLIKYGTVLGGEGFGFVPDEKKTYHRIPQTGTIVIEDDVVLGSNNCIDRAAYFETRIKRGTKFDNFVHIAHNVVVGEDVILTAGCIIAGSTTIGNRVIMSGQTGVLDHLKIADDVILVQRAGVMSDIKQAGIYAGIPPQPLSDYLKNSAVARKLTDLKAQIVALEKTVKNLIKSDGK